MAELPEERQALKVTLEAMQVDAWVWEKDAGAQSRTIRETYLDEVERADMFIGIFWRKYGLYTVEEYERARKLRKPILVYEKDVDLEARDPHLRDFLERIGRVDGDTAPGRFKTVPELEERLKNDVPRLLQQVVRGAAARPKARMAPPAHAERTVERGEILSRLRKRLLPRTPGETPPCTCAALVGMGGLGKTSLAVAFASAAAQAGSYADGLLWTQLGTEPNLPRRLSDWGLALEDLKPTQTYPDEQTASGRLSTLLSAGAYLLVIDDVWNADQLRPFLAGGSRCLHLVTTRHRDVAEAAGAEVLDVDAMTMAETLALMARWAGPIADGDLEAATWLAGEIGGLPLAVELLAAQAPTLGWQKLRQRWGSRGLELLRRGRDAKGKQNSVADSFSLSLDAMSGPDRGSYERLGVFPEKAQFPPAACAALWACDEDNARDLLEYLQSRALVRRYGATDAVRFDLHDLMHELVGERLGQSGLQAAHGELIAGYNPQCKPWHELPDDGYLYGHLAWHFRQAGQTHELEQLLGSCRWTEARLTHAPVSEVLSDFDLLGPTHELRLIQDALRLSAHVIGREVGQWRGQLLGRLPVPASSLVQAFAEDLRCAGGGVWLRPLTPSLIQTGGPLIRTLIGHEKSVFRVVMAKSANGNPIVVSAGVDGLRAWDPERGAQLWALAKRRHAIAIGALTDGKPFLVATRDETVCFLDLDTGEPIDRPIGPVAGGIRSLAFGWLEGKPVVVTGSGVEGEFKWSEEGGSPEEAKDCVIRIWDARTGETVGDPLVGHTEPVSKLALAAMHGRLVIASSSAFGRKDEPPLRLWGLDRDWGRFVRRVYAFVFGRLADDALFLAIGGEFEELVVHSDHASAVRLKGHRDDVVALTVGELDGKPILVSGSGTSGSRRAEDCSVRIWDPASGAQIGQPLVGHSDVVSSVAFGHLRSGTPVIVSGSHDGTVLVWNALAASRPGESRQGHTRPVVSLAFGDLDGKPIVVSGGDSTVRIWDPVRGVQLGEPLVQLGEDLGQTPILIEALAFGRLANGLAVIVIAHRGKGWTVSSGSMRIDHLMQVWDAAARKPLAEPHVIDEDWVTALTCGFLGKTAVAVSCSQGGTFRIWDLETRKPYGEPVLHNSSTKHEKRVTGAAIGELSARPVIVSAGLNGEARIWDPATGVQVGEPLRGHQSGDPSLGDFRYVTAVDFGYVKGQPRIITGGNDATVRVWDPHTSQQLGRSLAGHKDGITSVRIAIVQGRATVVSASEDSTVRLWDAETGEELAMFVSDSPVRTCAISPNGEMVVAGCRSGVIHFFSIEN